jgi:Holliday junction resolvase RusA-like endonuclease
MTEKRYKISATLPLPPTSNNIYINRREGGRVKSTEARSWQNRAVKEIVRQSGLTVQDEFDPTRMYWLDLHFYFKEVINKGWNEYYKRGGKKGQRKAENKWKKIDLGNRLKLLEDTVKIAVGVDDSATFVLHLIKDCDSENPRVEVQMFSMPGDEP